MNSKDKRVYKCCICGNIIEPSEQKYQVKIGDNKKGYRCKQCSDRIKNSSEKKIADFWYDVFDGKDIYIKRFVAKTKSMISTFGYDEELVVEALNYALKSGAVFKPDTNIYNELPKYYEQIVYNKESLEEFKKQVGSFTDRERQKIVNPEVDSVELNANEIIQLIQKEDREVMDRLYGKTKSLDEIVNAQMNSEWGFFA